MDVYSELKSAQVEILASDPAATVKGRIYQKSATEPLKIADGTSIHTVVTDRNAASVRSVFTDALYPVGELKFSMMTEAQFQAAYSNKWMLMKGQIVDPSDYPVLAALRPEWVTDVDVLVIPQGYSSSPFGQQDDSEGGLGFPISFNVNEAAAPYMSGVAVLPLLPMNIFLKVL